MTQASSSEHPRLITAESVSIMSTYRTPGATPVMIVSHNTKQTVLEMGSIEYEHCLPFINEIRAIMGARSIASGIRPNRMASDE